MYCVTADFAGCYKVETGTHAKMSTYMHSLMSLFLVVIKMQRLRCELPSAIMRLIPDSGHLPHVDNPATVAKLIAGFAWNGHC